MDDKAIIRLFGQRSEDAIREVAKKYCRLLTHIAGNIVATTQDAEECVSDTYLKLWNSIPPANPESLRNYAARITRNAAIDRYRRGTRRAEMGSVLEELAETFADVRDDYEEAALKALVNGFLETLDRETRILFVRRYWHAEPLGPLARHMGLKESAVKMRLLRAREKLKRCLSEGGYQI